MHGLGYQINLLLGYQINLFTHSLQYIQNTLCRKIPTMIYGPCHSFTNLCTVYMYSRLVLFCLNLSKGHQINWALEQHKYTHTNKQINTNTNSPILLLNHIYSTVSGLEYYIETQTIIIPNEYFTDIWCVYCMSEGISEGERGRKR